MVSSMICVRHLILPSDVERFSFFSISSCGTPQDTYIYMLKKKRYLFAHISSYAYHSLKRSSRSTEDGRPDTVVEVWARSVQCVARGVRSKFFSGGSGYDDFPGFLFEAIFGTRHPPFSNCWVFLAHAYLFENVTACHNSAITLGALCRDRFGVHYHPRIITLGALRAVSRVHVPCIRSI